MSRVVFALVPGKSRTAPIGGCARGFLMMAGYALRSEGRFAGQDAFEGAQ